jgi:hypothetical protein
VVNPNNEKGVDSPTLDPKQTKTTQRYEQKVGNETNKLSDPFNGPLKAVIKVKGKQISILPNCIPT